MSENIRKRETPASLGFRMPAEWEPHHATWFSWPHNKEDWPGKFEPVPWVYAEIIRHLTRHERAGIVVRDAKMQERASEILAKAGAVMERVDFVHAPTNRVWMRDSGPIFVTKAGKQPEIAAIDWKFNAWAKYDNHRHDDRLPTVIADHLGLRRFTPTARSDEGKMLRVVLEGGAIDVNGCGTLMTTEECLLSPIQARNPWLSKAGLEQVLADYLGIEHVIWLDKGIVGDDTHGHVDDIARFVAPRTVVTVVEPDKGDANYKPLKQNWKRLRKAHDQDGKMLEVVALPMPEKVVFDGERLPASYANFLIANQLVLVPTFNDVNDREALRILEQLFPDRDVVGIHAVDLVWGLGTIHCMTQQQPAIA